VNGASGVQINKDWVLVAAHVATRLVDLLKQNPGDVSYLGQFDNAYIDKSTSPWQSALSDCEVMPGYVQPGSKDLAMCRIVSPSKFINPPSFPPLMILPVKLDARLGNSISGSLMLWGRGQSSNVDPNKTGGAAYASVPDGFNSFSLFDGAPFGLIDATVFKSTESFSSCAPKGISGDSGGGVFWYAKQTGSSVKSAIVGLTATPNPLSRSPYYLDQAAKDFILSKAATFPGTAQPVFVDYASLSDAQAVNLPPANLAASPTVQSSGNSINFSWVPSTLNNVDGFELSVRGIDNSGFIGPLAVASNSITGYSLPKGGLAVGDYYGCVTPVNFSIGSNVVKNRASTVGMDGGGNVLFPNCSTFTTNLPVMSNLTAVVGVGSTAALRKVSAKWSLTTLSAYLNYVPTVRVRQVVVAAGGTSRTTDVLRPYSTIGNYNVTLAAGGSVTLTISVLSGSVVVAESKVTASLK
jgi:hypothetical protein